MTRLSQWASPQSGLQVTLGSIPGPTGTVLALLWDLFWDRFWTSSGHVRDGLGIALRWFGDGFGNCFGMVWGCLFALLGIINRFTPANQPTTAK